MYCKGVIVRIRPCAGCVEVVVAGEPSGTFTLDNCYVAALRDPNGPGLIGRVVEYRDGYMRFLDEIEEAQTEEPSPSTIPFPHPARSTHHI